MRYGWDISTSIVGMAEFDNSGKFIRAEHCDLRKVDGLNEKADVFRIFVEDYVKRIENNTHFVEERLGNFAAGRSMLQTLMKLAAFNAVCSFILYHNDAQCKVVHIHPSTWKSIMKHEGLIIPKGTDKKKELTLQFVTSHVDGFNVPRNKNANPQPWAFDMADAYCIGRSGYLRLCNVKES